MFVRICNNHSQEIRRAVCLLAGAAFVLASCTSDPPWTLNAQSNGRRIVDSTDCPSVKGTYSNLAVSASGCSTLDSNACKSLTFYLFSAHVPEAVGVSNYPTPDDDWPSGTQVRIDQPSNSILRIETLIESQSVTPKVVSARELFLDRGDYECSKSTIRLRPRIERDYALWAGRRTNTDYRSVSINQGVLTIESVRQYETYVLWLLGGTMREEHSVMHWRKIK